MRSRILYALLVLGLFLALGPCSKSWGVAPARVTTGEAQR